MANSRLCKLSLQLIFVTLTCSTTIASSFLELAEEVCFGHAYVFYLYDVRGQPSRAFTAPEARWALCWAGRHSGRLLRLKLSLAIWCQTLSTSSFGEIAWAAWSLPVENPGPRTLQEGRSDDGSLYPDLRGEAEQMTPPQRFLTLFRGDCWLWTGGCQDPCWLWHHWRWRCSYKYSVPLLWGWCYRCWSEKCCTLTVEASVRRLISSLTGLHGNLKEI